MDALEVLESRRACGTAVKAESREPEAAHQRGSRFRRRGTPISDQ
jgi:hypothetical protein